MHLGNRFIIKISNKFPLSIRKILEFRKILYVNSRVKSRNGKSFEIVDSAERKRPGAQRSLNWNNVTMISSCKEKKNPVQSKIYAESMPRRREFPVRNRTFAIADAIQVSRQYFSFLSSPLPSANSPQLRVNARRPKGSSASQLNSLTVTDPHSFSISILRLPFNQTSVPSTPIILLPSWT